MSEKSSKQNPASPGVSHAVEDYLKVIYKLQEHGGHVTTSAIAERMELSAASVSNMMKKLADMRLATHTKYRGVALTEHGTKIALEVVRHHRLLERYLHDALGYSWDVVDAEAEALEHVMSEELEAKMDEALGHPTHDPHGAPIPTKDGLVPERTECALKELKSGQAAVIVRVSDQDPELLRYADSLGLRPSAQIVVGEKAPFGGSISLIIEGIEHSVSEEAASRIYCVPHS